jgi:hypothetical protein
MAADSVFIPRPLAEPPPEVDELAAATADSEPEDVLDVGLESAPASGRDVVAAVAVLDIFAGAVVPEAVEF